MQARSRPHTSPQKRRSYGSYTSSSSRGQLTPQSSALVEKEKQRRIKATEDKKKREKERMMNSTGCGFSFMVPDEVDIRTTRLQFLLDFIEELYFCHPVQMDACNFLSKFLMAKPFLPKRNQRYLNSTV